MRASAFRGMDAAGCVILTSATTLASRTASRTASRMEAAGQRVGTGDRNPVTANSITLLVDSSWFILASCSGMGSQALPIGSLAPSAGPDAQHDLSLYDQRHFYELCGVYTTAPGL